MKKVILIILLFAFSFSLFSTPVTRESFGEKYEYEEYKDEEFPLWSIELRRGESLFFGSLALTYPLSLMIFGFASPDMDVKDKALWSLIPAVSSSLILSVADWIIGKVQK